MATWQEFQDELLSHSEFMSAQPDLIGAYQNVFQAAKTEDRDQVSSSMYVLFDAARRKVQPAGVDEVINKLMTDSNNIDSEVGGTRKDRYPFSPKL